MRFWLMRSSCAVSPERRSPRNSPDSTGPPSSEWPSPTSSWYPTLLRNSSPNFGPITANHEGRTVPRREGSLIRRRGTGYGAPQLVDVEARHELEGGGHVLARFGACGHRFPAVGCAQSLQPTRADLDLVRDVRFVEQDDGRDSARNGSHGIGPLRETHDRLGASRVRDEQESLRPMEIGIPEDLPKAATPHDVPDRSRDFEGVPPATRIGDRKSYRGHLRAEGRNVGVVERVGDEPAHERGLADAGIPREGDLDRKAGVPRRPIGGHLALGVVGRG